MKVKQKPFGKWKWNSEVVGKWNYHRKLQRDDKRTKSERNNSCAGGGGENVSEANIGKLLTVTHLLMTWPGFNLK